MLVVSYAQAGTMLACIRKNSSPCEVSLDLGVSKSSVPVQDGRVLFPGGNSLGAEDLEKITKEDTACFIVGGASLEKIELYSENTRKYYKLVPTGSSPTIEISGIRMHRTKEVNPLEDTKLKLKTVAPIRGKVLDICTGLGYTAMMAARSAEKVFTLEQDENVLEIARMNPWSRELFENPKIKIELCDAFEKVKKFHDDNFDIIIHDPPRFSLAGNLYSEEFYHSLFRILKKGGKLFHYTGNPGEKKGRDLPMGVIKRLRSAGFCRVFRKEEALGVIATK